MKKLQRHTAMHSALLVLGLGMMNIAPLTVAAETTTAPSIANGAKVYNENCGRCHNPRPAEQYTSREWSVILPHMRAKGHLTRQETLDVEAFMMGTLHSGKEVTANPVNQQPVSIERGQQLVAKYGCQGCHSINGQGGQLGPNLNTVFKARGGQFIAQKLANPSFNNPASAMPKFPLNKGDIDSIAAYLKSISE